jgi:hypothetical protein
MKADTEKLIENLAQNLRPTRAVAGPSANTALWFAASVPYMTIVLLTMIVRNGMPSLVLDLRFIVEIIAGLAAGLVSAACAFGSVIPGRDRRLLLLLIVLITVWLGSVGENCIQGLSRDGFQSLSLRHDLNCLPFIAFHGLFPAIVLVLMLRRGAPLSPHLTAALAGIAAAGLGNFALRLIFPEPADAGLFLWHIGGVFVLAALVGSMGHHLLNWRSIRKSI